jgi:NADH-quinone oxidoreductase subunit M
VGLPGLGNFVGEFLVLIGSYRVSVPITVFAALGLVTSVIYAVWIVQRVVHGPEAGKRRLPDLDVRETALAGILAAMLLWLGVYPQPVLKVTAAAMHAVQEEAALRSPAAQTDDATAAKAPMGFPAVEAAGWFKRGGQP